MFKFGLQRVLDLREKKEQEVATELAAARERAEAARAAAAALAGVRLAGEEQLAAAHAGASTVGELRQLAYVLDQLDLHIAAAEGVAAERDADVGRAQLDLNAAFRDRHVLDRLKERHLDAHRANAAQADRQTMDAIALSRFGRRDTT